MNIESILNRLESRRANVLDLLRMYQSDEDARPPWRKDSRLYRAFSRRLTTSGQPNRALELVREGLEAHPDDRDLKYLGALALKRGGNIQRAAEYINKLLQDP